MDERERFVSTGAAAMVAAGEVSAVSVQDHPIWETASAFWRPSAARAGTEVSAQLLHDVWLELGERPGSVPFLAQLLARPALMVSEALRALETAELATADDDRFGWRVSWRQGQAEEFVIAALDLALAEVRDEWRYWSPEEFAATREPAEWSAWVSGP